MTNDETLADDAIEETQEDIESEADEIIENDDDSVPTIEDYQNLQKKVKTLQAQKEHWRTKATKTKETTTNKPNEEKSVVSIQDEIELAILRDKGLSDDVEKTIIDLKALAKMKGENPTFKQLLNHPAVVALQEKEDIEIKKKKAQLGASGGSGGVSKKEMTPEEHKDFAKQKSQEYLKNY